MSAEAVRLPSMLVGVLVAACLAGTGLIVGVSVGIRSAAELALTCYVVAFTEIVAVSLLLSAFGSFTHGPLVATTVVVFIASAAVWVLRGTPRVHGLDVSGALAGWPVRTLAVVVALALIYVLALVIGTPPNGWDPLNYHLARAAFWLQRGHIGYIPHAYDERLNFNPPNGEIGMAFALGVTHNEIAAPFVQFFATVACAVCVFLLGRRLGLRRNEALFGGLLFLTLPIVVLQSAGAKNDVVVASFVLAACVFVLGTSRASLISVALATALAIGTKFTGAYGLPILLGFVLVTPPAWRVRSSVAIVVGALAGAYWYVVNAIDSGRLLGDQSGTGHLTAPFQPRENMLTAYGDAVDTADVSGATGHWILLYVAAAVAVAVALVATRRPRQALVAAILVASPLLLLAASTEIGRPTLTRLYNALGKPNGYLAIGDAVASSPRTASDTASWFGPLGFLLVLACLAAALVLARRGGLPIARAVVALTPLVWFVVVALTLTYHPWQGRFFIAPVAVSAALWGLCLRRSELAWSAVALAGVTAFLSLDHFVEKPRSAVWHEARWQVQSQHDPAIGPVFQFVDEHVPRHDSIALALGPNEFSFPFFGPHLTRRVELETAVSTRWLFADAQRSGQVDMKCWRARLQSERGTVFERLRGCRPSSVKP